MQHTTGDRQPFEVTFQHLTGNLSFPWQTAMYERFVSDRPDNIPALCNLEIGLGKTSVFAIWLIAVANQPDRIPRRLVYVVNRRAMVDQAAVEVDNLRSNLVLPELKTLRQSLSTLCSKRLDVDEAPLNLSTLRDQIADNSEWCQDPSRPTVIIGTADMIASRILFSDRVGGPYGPTHFSPLAQDILLIHEDARLEPAFQGLLYSIQYQEGLCGDYRKLRVMKLKQTTYDRIGLHPEFLLTFAWTVTTLRLRYSLVMK